MDSHKLQQEIQKKVQNKLTPLFARYKLDPGNLEAALKWKSIVLVLGNFSSGKSTLINEIFEADIQRTGQAPTDDSFTVITAPDKNSSPQEIPGATLINDERLPFQGFKKYGDHLSAHMQMKQINSPILENLAIIDSPGMLDAITEKDRGYDYPAVIGDLAKLADLVVLMFDPHKAGTIQEVYNTIRTTLPEHSGEDRVIFVMSRIDECDNPGDLVRSYGTLCWNLSQMTGRKDIPRIFLTFSPSVSRNPEALSIWIDEREQLKQQIMNAPKLRISHLLQDIDKQANELKMAAEAMNNFSQRARDLFSTTLTKSLLLGLVLFFFLDIAVKELTGFPENTLLSLIMSGKAGLVNLIIPVASILAVFTLAIGWFSKWQFPRLVDRSIREADQLVLLDTTYRKHLWLKMQGRIKELLAEASFKELTFTHQKNLMKIERFIHRELQKYYEKIL
ncbi:MAG: dynamin family protein [Proteobacteria bacterium]|nr:dynamin family protein [Pseudomonadota bacterium]MBU1715338.1 dynamin family protein [Pseudomonadota bacterium]